MIGRAKLSGLGRLDKRLNLDPALYPALADAGEEIAHQARAELQAQGAAGDLVDSVNISVSANQVEAGSEHPAARAAEFGTLHQAAKPWLQPAFQAALGPVRARLRQALRDHLTQRQRNAP